jgi:hypothetical protein
MLVKFITSDQTERKHDDDPAFTNAPHPPGKLFFKGPEKAWRYGISIG